MSLRLAQYNNQLTTQTITASDAGHTQVIKAMNVSKAKGFASIIQPEYITDCKVESDDDCATGFVVFKRDAYSGSINFKASRVKQAWVIQEFEWPNICVRFKRGNDNNWSQEPVKK